jgi:hypothetical protein
MKVPLAPFSNLPSLVILPKSTTPLMTSSNCVPDLIKHSAEGSTIDHAWLHGEADDAASELIYDDHHPVGFEGQRFTSKEIDAPEAVLGVSEESHPGRTVAAAGRPTVFRQYTSHNILVDLDTKQESNLLSDAPAAEARVPTFHLNDRSDQLWARTFRAWLPPALRREEPAIFSLHQRVMEPHEDGGPNNKGRTNEASTTHQGRAQASNDSIEGS